MSSVTVSTFANIATDLVILSIPISTLLATKLDRVQRAGLAFVFLMGSISILAALIRFICLKLVQSSPRASITHTIDVWALVEIVSSLLAVCLPSLRMFVRAHTVSRPGGATDSGYPSSAGDSMDNSITRVDSEKSMPANVAAMWYGREEEAESVTRPEPVKNVPFV